MHGDSHAGMFAELQSARRRLDPMTTSKVSAKFGTRIRLVLAVMVAVVASMTLHHGAMAQGSELGRHQIASTSNHGDLACFADCTPTDHSMPVCCGMGLCLSGMPIDPAELLPELSNTARFAKLTTARPLEMRSRIDRPPKNFPKV
tara:strand:+ start:2956 stop:3393 length:438 start_codon:yes stop_codon:yes gene_type:complete